MAYFIGLEKKRQQEEGEYLLITTEDKNTALRKKYIIY